MPMVKTSMWLTLYSVEKTKWKKVAKRHGLCLSDFIRFTMNAKVKMPSEDLVEKMEKKLPEQISMLEMGI